MKMAAARWIWLCNSSLYITITSPVSSRVSSLTDIRNMSRQKSESRTARVLVPPLTVVKHIVTEKGQTHPPKIPSHEVQFHMHCQTHIDISHNAALIMQSGWPWRRRSRLSHEIPWGLAVLRVDFLMMDTCMFLFPGWSTSPIHDLFGLHMCQMAKAAFFILLQHAFLLQANDWPIGLPCAKAMALWREKSSHDGEASSDKTFFLRFETAEQPLKVSKWADSCLMQAWATMVCWTSLGHSN